MYLYIQKGQSIYLIIILDFYCLKPNYWRNTINHINTIYGKTLLILFDESVASLTISRVPSDYDSHH